MFVIYTCIPLCKCVMASIIGTWLYPEDNRVNSVSMSYLEDLSIRIIYNSNYSWPPVGVNEA